MYIYMAMENVTRWMNEMLPRLSVRLPPWDPIGHCDGVSEEREREFGCIKPLREIVYHGAYRVRISYALKTTKSTERTHKHIRTHEMADGRWYGPILNGKFLLRNADARLFVSFSK